MRLAWMEQWENQLISTLNTNFPFPPQYVIHYVLLTQLYTGCSKTRVIGITSIIT